MLEVQKQKRVSPFSSKLFSRLIAFTAAFLVFALLFGVLISTYSTVFTATPIAYDLIRRDRKQA